MRFPPRRYLGSALFLLSGVIVAVACGSNAGSGGQGGGHGQPGGGLPVGDPNTGNWLDLGDTHAPAHEPAVATNTGVVTRGGTLTFTNIGAPGYWGRRIEAEPGDPRCDVQSETIDAEASGPQWGNRDVISTGIRSYQVGSLGGVTCGIQSCGIEKFPADADLLDVNSLTAMKEGAVIDADHPAMKEGPAWRRAQDDRYYLFLLDETSRVVQVAVIHPSNLPEAAKEIVPALPNTVPRAVIDGFLKLRLPQ